jgi:hypothetical protein
VAVPVRWAVRCRSSTSAQVHLTAGHPLRPPGNSRSTATRTPLSRVHRAWPNPAAGQHAGPNSAGPNSAGPNSGIRQNGEPSRPRHHHALRGRRHCGAPQTRGRTYAALPCAAPRYSAPRYAAPRNAERPHGRRHCGAPQTGGRTYAGHLYAVLLYAGRLYAVLLYAVLLYAVLLYAVLLYAVLLYAGRTYAGRPYAGRPYAGRPYAVLLYAGRQFQSGVHRSGGHRRVRRGATAQACLLEGCRLYRSGPGRPRVYRDAHASCFPAPNVARAQG